MTTEEGVELAITFARSFGFAPEAEVIKSNSKNRPLQIIWKDDMYRVSMLYTAQEGYNARPWIHVDRAGDFVFAGYVPGTRARDFIGLITGW